MGVSDIAAEKRALNTNSRQIRRTDECNCSFADSYEYIRAVFDCRIGTCAVADFKRGSFVKADDRIIAVAVRVCE